MARGQSKSDWLIEPLGKHHNRAAFSCGKDPLDTYLKKQASQDARRLVAAPFVLVSNDDPARVMGYFTLSAYGIDLGELPPDITRKLPQYPIVPTTLLGRLAVDQTLRGRGCGEFLLMEALNRAWSQSSKIAAAAVVVDAIDDEAWHFYRHFDFMPFRERRDRLFLPMATISKLFAGR